LHDGNEWIRRATGVNKDGFLFLFFNFSPFFTSLNFVACNTSNFCDLFSQKNHILGSSFCINLSKNLNFDQPIFDEPIKSDRTDFINIQFSSHFQSMVERRSHSRAGVAVR
jgi:hypothetical protein